MKVWLIVLAAIVVPVQAGIASDLAGKVWIHGLEDCETNRDLASASTSKPRSSS